MPDRTNFPTTFRAITAIAAALTLAAHATAQSTKFINLGRGPVAVHLPASYDPSVPARLIIMLHGYSSSGAQMESYVRFTALSETYGFLLTAPDGTRDLLGNQFWNATNACCNFFGSSVDDSGYLRALIDEIKVRCTVDQRRVYVVGHSNGGFMSYRMACEHADTIAAIASLAGATFLDPSACAPSTPIDTLQIHGTADAVIEYGGACLPGGGCFPGAVQSAETWATYNTCSLVPDLTAPPIDRDAGIPGPETTVAKYNRDCAPGGSAELWTIHGGGHVPNLSADFSRLVVEWLLDHPKPETCYADCDQSGVLDIFDFLCFQNSFVAGEAYACECDPDPACNIFDFLCFQNAFVSGCP